MLPQFNTDNFLSTSLFVGIFVFITYMFLKNTVIKYIENITLDGENATKNLKENQHEIKKNMDICANEIKKVKIITEKEYKNAENFMEKTYKENIIKIHEELEKTNREKEISLKEKIINEYKSNNITSILEDIKVNLNKGKK